MQVSINDLIMLVLFAPIVRFLVNGAQSFELTQKLSETDEEAIVQALSGG